jgi:hypothetical protein
MSRCITLGDAQRVLALRGLSPSPGRPDCAMTSDGWQILVSGWHHREGWSRGYTIGDGVGVRPGYVTSVYRDARYSGRGWHKRMADDIARDLARLRANNGSRRTMRGEPLDPDHYARLIAWLEVS